jgi:hypothetical protein
MRRLARHAFTVLSTLSLLLCVAACVLWVRSYRIKDDLRRHTPAGADRHQAVTMLMSGKGGLAFCHMDGTNLGALSDWTWTTRQGAPAYAGGITWSPPSSPLASRAGFDVLRMDGPGTQLFAFMLPIWSIVIGTALMPAWHVLVLHRRRVRRNPGHCPACGYDLRASPARCPECGRTTRPGAFAGCRHHGHHDAAAQRHRSDPPDC